MHMMNFPTPCKGQLFGPVRFCPFCGRDIVSLDESLSPQLQKIEKPVELTHVFPPCVDIVSPPLVADANDKETVTPEPISAKESPPVEKPSLIKEEPAKQQMFADRFPPRFNSRNGGFQGAEEKPNRAIHFPVHCRSRSNSRRPKIRARFVDFRILSNSSN